jgi:hypothetical protein
MTIHQWLESLPKRGDETLIGVPPSALAMLLAERDRLREAVETKNTEDSNAVSVESTALLAVLSSWGELAHDETKGFCQRFCPKAWILTQVSWDSENMRFVYILDCGQHVADSVKISEWLEFLSANDEMSDRPEAALRGEEES